MGEISKKRIVLVVNPDQIHIGSYFKSAVEQLGIPYFLCDFRQAFVAPYWSMKFNWWLRGHRPARLHQFSQNVIEACMEFKANMLLSTGFAPIEACALRKLKGLGVRTLNYLTDDPFNQAHRAPWFMSCLLFYDHIFSPRLANIQELKNLGCANVKYLPFAYSPDVHYPEPLINDDERKRFDADLVFIGGADEDRIPYICALIESKFKVALYGSYWGKFRQTRNNFYGHADQKTMRKAISGSRIVLCLVREANRDGNSMRSFETPAIGACMLTEDTPEHRQLFGEDEKSVIYFKGIGEMVQKAGLLLNNESLRIRLANCAHSLILSGNNTYKDRLLTMITLGEAR